MGSEVRSVTVRLTMDVAQAIAANQAYGKSVTTAAATAEAATMRQSKAMDTLGRTAGKVGLGAAAALGLMVKAAMDWESEWAGVSKTVNGTDAELNQLEDDLRGLARTMPATHQEIAATAEAAGQLGVATEDVADFTKVMVEMGAATNLSADDAATSIAQFMNVMQTVPDEVDEIGNTIVDLGNKGASTESQIVNMAQRLAGAGHLIGASESDVLGLAAAMANLGIQAEVGGSSAQRVLLNMYNAMSSGKSAIQGWADVAGQSAAEFAQKWQSAPIDALDDFLQGLNKIKESGGNVVGTLNDLGVKGVQNQRVILALAGSGDMLSKSLKQSATAWEQNSALIAEYEKRAATTASQVQVAWNNIKDAGIDAGESLLPVVASVAHSLSGMASAYRSIPGPAKGAINGLLGTTAVLGLGVWGATKAVGTIRDIKGALDALPMTAERSSAALRGLATAAAGLAVLEVAGAGITAIQEAADESLPGIDTLALRLLQLKNGQIASLGTEFDSLGDSIRRVSDKTTEESFSDTMSGIFNPVVPWDDRAKGLREATAEIDSIDQALTSLVQTGGPETAAAALDAFAEKAGLTTAQLVDLKGLLPSYTNAVDAAAVSDEAAAAAADRKTGALKSGADAIEGLIGPTDATTASVASLGSQMTITTLDAKEFKAEFEALNGVLSASDSMVAYERAIDALSDSMKKNGSFDAGIEAGRTNIENMNAVVSTAIQRSEALKDAGHDLAAVRVLTRAKDDLDEFGAKSEGARRRAKPLIDELTGTIGNLRLKVDPAPALDAIGDTGAALHGLTGKNWRVDVDADTDPAKRKGTQLDGFFTDLVGHPYTADVDADTSDAWAKLNAVQQAHIADKIFNVTANISKTASNALNGMKFATGGTPALHVASGRVRGPGGPTDDMVPAMLSNDEFVMSAAAVDHYGLPTMFAMNAMRLAGGGPADRDVPHLAAGGQARSLDDRLAIAQLLQEIQGYHHDLTEIIKKGPNKGEHAVRGIARQVLELQLEAAERDLKRAKHADEREEQQKATQRLADLADMYSTRGGLFDSLLPDDPQTVTQGVSATIADFRHQWVAAGGEWGEAMRDWAKNARQAARQYDKTTAAIDAETIKRDQLAQTLDDQKSQLETLTSVMASYGDTVGGNFLNNGFNGAHTDTVAGAAGPATAALEAATAELAALRASTNGDSIEAAARAADLIAKIQQLTDAAAAETKDTEVQVSGLSALRTTLETDTQHANEMTAALQELAAKGLDTTGEFGGLYQQLAANGDYATAEELASMSAEQIDEYEKMFAARDDAVATLVAQSTQAVYGDQQAALEQQVALTQSAVDASNAAIELMTATLPVLAEQVRAGSESGAAKTIPKLVNINDSIKDLARQQAENTKKAKV